MRGRARLSFALLPLLAVAAQGGTAQAGNEDSFLFGDQASLTGGAVVASARDTASIWYNPAGLGQNQRGRVELSGTAFNLRYRPITKGLALDLPSGRTEQTIASNELFVAPTALTAVRQIADGLSAGFGLFVTEQDIYDFEATAQPKDSAVNLDLAGALTGTVLRYHLGPSIGYQATRDLRIGLSLFGVYEKEHQFRKLFANAQMTGPYDSTFFQRLVDAQATRLGSELVLGAQLDAGDGWDLGLAVRSPRWIFYESAATDNSTSLVSKGTTVPTVADAAVDHIPIGAEGTGLDRAPRFTGGAAKRVGPIELSGEVEFRPAGVGGAMAARPVVNIRSGLLWRAGPNTVLGGGFFSDRSGAGPPVTFPDSRVDYQGLALGWKQRHQVRLHAKESAESLVFSTTIAVRYAVGVGESTRIRFDFRDAAQTGIVGRVADEQVSVVYHEASVYLGTGLEF